MPLDCVRGETPHLAEVAGTAGQRGFAGLANRRGGLGLRDFLEGRGAPKKDVAGA
jgi:hypothetical protein